MLHKTLNLFILRYFANDVKFTALAERLFFVIKPIVWGIVVAVDILRDNIFLNRREILAVCAKLKQLQKKVSLILHFSD